MVTGLKLTADAFLNLPETLQPTSLIDGEVIVSPAPTIDHQRLVFRLGKLIEQLAGKGETLIAPVDVKFDAANVPQPDVLWLAPDGNARIVEGKYVEGAPALIAEVLSPGTELQDRKYKFTLYERFGVREYWLVDPFEKFIEVWVLTDQKFVRLGIFSKDETFKSNVLATEVQSQLIFVA